MSRWNKFLYEIEMKPWNTVVLTAKIETIETMCSGASVNDVERERERDKEEHRT